MNRHKNSFLFKLTAHLILFSFFVGLVLPPKVQAQSMLSLPQPGVMVPLSPVFHSPVIKGLKIFPDNPLKFDFIIDTGDAGSNPDNLQAESKKLIKYFLASLTVPEEDLWVNLSPYEKDRIIPEGFGQTEMGRDLLAQDYILKQITASLIYPEDELGAKFWDKIYKKANELYGTTEIPVNTFNKVWIVPEKAIVYEKGEMVFVVKSHLKVMLEGDYLALKENLNSNEKRADQLNENQSEQFSDVSSSIIREVILPALEKEVNEGEKFGALRQIYHSMILATWFKRNLKESFLGEVYIDQNKVDGIEVADKNAKEKIYQQYLEAFKIGVYDYIKEDYNLSTKEFIPRKYFSGGVALEDMDIENDSTVSEGQISSSIRGELFTTSAFLRENHGNYQKKIAEVIESIVAELEQKNFNVGQKDGKYLLKETVESTNAKRIELENGHIRIEADGILVIVDERLSGNDHAGRGTYQLAVYAQNEDKALHELTELRAWIDFAKTTNWSQNTQRKIATEAEIKNGELGNKLQEWANGAAEPGISQQELLYRQNFLIEKHDQFHKQGLIAEGRVIEASRYKLPPRLESPLTGFDITIASDGRTPSFNRKESNWPVIGFFISGLGILLASVWPLIDDSFLNPHVQIEHSVEEIKNIEVTTSQSEFSTYEYDLNLSRNNWPRNIADDGSVVQSDSQWLHNDGGNGSNQLLDVFSNEANAGNDVELLSKLEVGKKYGGFFRYQGQVSIRKNGQHYFLFLMFEEDVVWIPSLVVANLVKGSNNSMKDSEFTNIMEVINKETPHEVQDHSTWVEDGKKRLLDKEKNSFTSIINKAVFLSRLREDRIYLTSQGELRYLGHVKIDSRTNVNSFAFLNLDTGLYHWVKSWNISAEFPEIPYYIPEGDELFENIKVDYLDAEFGRYGSRLFEDDLQTLDDGHIVQHHTEWVEGEEKRLSVKGVDSQSKLKQIESLSRLQKGQIYPTSKGELKYLGHVIIASPTGKQSFAFLDIDTGDYYWVRSSKISEVEEKDNNSSVKHNFDSEKRIVPYSEILKKELEGGASVETHYRWINTGGGKQLLKDFSSNADAQNDVNVLSSLEVGKKYGGFLRYQGQVSIRKNGQHYFLFLMFEEDVVWIPSSDAANLVKASNDSMIDSEFTNIMEVIKKATPHEAQDHSTWLEDGKKRLFDKEKNSFTSIREKAEFLSRLQKDRIYSTSKGELKYLGLVQIDSRTNVNSFAFLNIDTGRHHWVQSWNITSEFPEKNNNNPEEDELFENIKIDYLEAEFEGDGSKLNFENAIKNPGDGHVVQDHTEWVEGEKERLSVKEDASKSKLKQIESLSQLQKGQIYPTSKGELKYLGGVRIASPTGIQSFAFLDMDTGEYHWVKSWNVAAASSAALKTQDQVGGIDLNPNILDLQSQGEGVKYNKPLKPQNFQNLSVDGFTPVIINITPTSMPLLLGLASGQQKQNT